MHSINRAFPWLHRAGVVALLCTGHAGFVTGQIVHVDGGASLMDPSFPLAIQWPGAAAAHAAERHS